MRPLPSDATKECTFPLGLEALRHQLRIQDVTTHKLVRLTVAIQAFDYLDFLQNTECDTRCYFSDRNQEMTVAGLGRAVELNSGKPKQRQALFSRAKKIIAGSEALWVCGLAYSGRSGTQHWQNFPGAQFILPQIELRQHKGLSTVSINLYAESFGEWQQQISSITCQLRTLLTRHSQNKSVSKIVARRDSIDLAIWREQVEETVHQIEHSDLQKVVLAREVSLEFDHPPSAFQSLKNLKSGNNHCFSFLIENDGKQFFGSSPERLYKKQATTLRTEALAGTVRRGVSPQQDTEFENHLRHDPKLVHEHQLVTHGIAEAIEPLAISLECAQEIKILKLSHVQHRLQTIMANLKPQTTNSEIYHNLHPSPAVCGYPRKTAQAFINELEQVCRGWYSGSVGILGAQSSEFCVAIRSAFSDKKHLKLYSGVGIVKGSVADTEWQELESKLESMLHALCYDEAVSLQGEL